MSDFNGFSDEVLHALNVVREINLRISNLEAQIADIEQDSKVQVTWHNGKYAERIRNREDKIKELKSILSLDAINQKQQ